METFLLRVAVFNAMLLLGLACGPGDETLARLQALDVNPGNANAARELHSAGLTALRESNPDRARQLWAAAAEEDPSNWTAFFNLACLESEAGRPQIAVEYVRLALARPHTPRLLRLVRSDESLAAMRASAYYADLESEMRGSADQNYDDLIGERFACQTPDQSIRLALTLQANGELEGETVVVGPSGTQSCKDGHWRADGGNLVVELNCSNRQTANFERVTVAPTSVSELEFISVSAFREFFERCSGPEIESEVSVQ
ncbi:MAG: hypothetical protein KDK35_11110 [Leptospiraceae bacterium]|nr:hypothetical protein [Leptospiraceae bacterium]